jgi:Zn-finger nucleic acid-binding protein
LRLIACSNCHTQYDVSQVVEKQISCRCGEVIENHHLEAQVAEVHRCAACGAQASLDAVECEYCGAGIVKPSDSLSLICPECYGRNADDSRFCTACGVAFDPEPIPIEGSELPCPCCTRLMPVRRVGGLAVNECPECNGLWVPGEKFDQLVDQAIESREQAGPDASASAPRVKGANPYRQSVQYRKCPVCEAFMQRSNFRKTSGVIIDRCHNHGTWLDADELERIAGYILSGGRPESDRTMRAMDEHARTRPRDPFPINTPAHSADPVRLFEMTPSPGDGLTSSVLKIFAALLD